MSSISKQKGAKGAADRIFSELVRSIGHCENCGRKPPSVQLQCAHIMSRRYSNTRVDFRNAYSLCAGCHRYYTDHPVEFAKFIQRTWASEFYDDTYAMSQSTNKVDWPEKQRFLKEARKLLNAGEISLDDLRRGKLVL